MARFLSLLVLAAALPQGAAWAQQGMDGLMPIPGTGGEAPVFGPIETLPLIDIPGMAAMADAPSPIAVPQDGLVPLPPQPALIGSPIQEEAEPFFEFSDAPAPGHTTGAGAVGPRVLWPGEILTPADEEPPILGQGAVARLLISPEEAARRDAQEAAAALAAQSPDFAATQAQIQASQALPFLPAPSAALMQTPPAIPGPVLPAIDAALSAPIAQDLPAGEAGFAPLLPSPPAPPVVVEVAPHERFAFRDAPAEPALPKGMLLSVPPDSRVQGHRAASGTSDAQWDESANGLGVVRLDLAKDLGGVTLVLDAQTPVFWGATTQPGTHIDGVLMFGPAAEFSTFGAQTTNRVRAPVVRRPDLDEGQAQRLVREGGGGIISWQ